VSRKYANPPGSPERRAAPGDYLSFFAKQTLSSFSQPRVPAGHVLPREKALQQFDDYQNADSITWLGHAAFLIRAGGQTVLIDPYLSKIAGPGLFGPARFASSEIGLSDFGKIDAVLLTHNHYDHFDTQTLRVLARDSSIRVTVPTGLGRAVRQVGFRAHTELAWYDTFALGDLTITATPAIHWSKRGPFDENTSHWCGYLMEWEGHRVYFVGDTGYGSIFETMGARFGEIDLGIVGIGAYEPQIIMQPVHTSPEEAVRLCFEESQRFFCASLSLDLVAGSPEDVDTELADSLLILHEQDVFPSTSIGLQRISARRRVVHQAAFAAHQIDGDARPAPLLTRHLHRAAPRAHDVEHRGQSEPRALTECFGGEERFEDLALHPFAHPNAVISHRELDAAAGEIRRRLDRGCLQHDRSAMGHRIPRVEHEIHHDLLHLRGVDQGPRQAGSGGKVQLVPFPDQPLQQGSRRGEHRVHVHDARLTHGALLKLRR